MAAVIEQNFYISGPAHLVGTNIDWENAHHRRIIMASLVQGVYTLKSDIEKGRVEREALAPQWWKLFNFEKTKDLHDPKDGTIFGAIFKFHSPNNHNYRSHSRTIRPPKFVIAFRGTSLTKDSAFQDLKLDSKCILNLIRKSRRFGVALSAVEKAIDENRTDPNEIWLAGHSLGAAIALSVGKDIVLSRKIHLETYLYNPPCVHFPIVTLGNKSPVLKSVIRFFRTIVTAAVATMQGFDQEDETEFIRLSKWKPYMFLNKKDRICNEYIEYFKNRDWMARAGLENIEKVATQNSITSLIPGASARPSHLLPVAYLVINLSPDAQHFKQAHRLKQWWTPPSDFYYESKLHDTFWQADFGEFSN